MKNDYFIVNSVCTAVYVNFHSAIGSQMKVSAPVIIQEDPNRIGIERSSYASRHHWGPPLAYRCAKGELLSKAYLIG